jgi:hypothetical protein
LFAKKHKTDYQAFHDYVAHKYGILIVANFELLWHFTRCQTGINWAEKLKTLIRHILGATMNNSATT